MVEMVFDPRDDFHRFDEALSAADMAWWEIELPSGAVFFSENKTRMLGYEKENFFHYTSFTNLLHPDDYPKAMTAMEEHISGKTPYYETTYRIKAKNGTYRKFYDRGKITQRKDEVTCISGIVADITDLRPEILQ